MNLFDVIKCEVNDKELVYKFSSENLRLGSLLVVYPTQTAFFVKGGVILDEFICGTYTLKTENIPLLGKLINLPFNGQTPFKAEVWFINQIAILDCKWGTASPIQIEDPKYGIIVPIRAFGQYGFKIISPRQFLESLVSNMTSFTVEKLTNYFRGIIMSKLTNIVSEKLSQDGISVININSHISDISEFCQQRIGVEFEKYGLKLENFNVIGINVQENDPSFIRLKEAKDLAARLKITGKDVYQMERSFNVLENAASNEGGGLVSSGVGIGMGLNIGNQVGSMAMNTLNVNPPSLTVPPPLPVQEYYIAVNGQQQGAFDFNTIKVNIENGTIQGNTLIWKKGMANWGFISQLPEFSSFFNELPPKLPTM